MDAAVAGLIGTLGGAIIGFVGSEIQRRGAVDAAVDAAERAHTDEHGQWLRDQRVEAYAELNGSVSALARTVIEISDDPDAGLEYMNVMQAFQLASSRALIVGSESMKDRTVAIAVELAAVNEGLMEGWARMAAGVDPSAAMAKTDAALATVSDLAGAFTAAASEELSLAPRLHGEALSASDTDA